MSLPTQSRQFGHRKNLSYRFQNQYQYPIGIPVTMTIATPKTIATPIIGSSDNKGASNAGAITEYAMSTPKYNVSLAIEKANRSCRFQKSLNVSREGSSEVMVLPTHFASA
jgi:hypothetical protein